MFRIESYITPIILSHIDKYVKDFRPQDAQLSLWGGEASFQNLDVRLDVLEEELNCPFSLVSGHIHELTVRVPWTKIASEPVQITINTIEFVLKLKTEQPRRVPRRKSNRSEPVPEPSGYMASLVNKIANNISVKLNNIILKYVEEDIVISMNIQLLTFDSADDNWNAAFVDINPHKVILKKIIQISDLTVCLDKRNSLGKIDVCQEPILYRCSLQIRLLRKYNILSAHRSSVTRIDVFTDSMELNISAQQYPMFLRLIDLAMALREGTIKKEENASTSPDLSVEDEMDEDNQESLISWAYNMLPSIFPVDSSENDDEYRGHILHTGFYINNLKITFKSQELLTDSIVHSSKKIKYHPILTISMNGIYSDCITTGTRWLNMKGGISAISVVPVELCPCGKKHIQPTIFSSAEVLYNHDLFLKDSLSDKNCPENQGKPRKYNTSWDLHFLDTSEEQLKARTPAISIDMTHFIDINDDDQKSSILSSDLEYSNLSEMFLCRVFIGQLNFKYCASLIHIIDTLQEYTKSYNYVPYSQDKLPLTLAQLNPPSTEDFEALMADIPLKVYQINISKSVFEFHVSDHEYLWLSNRKVENHQYPFVIFEMERANVSLSSPYYPNRLVHTTCQLPNPPNKLVDNCYQKIECDFQNMSIYLQNSVLIEKLVTIPSMVVSFKELIQSELWATKKLAKHIYSIAIDKIYIEVNKPQVLVHQIILDTYLNSNSNKGALETSILTDINDKNLPIIELSMQGMEFIVSIINKTIGFYGHIETIEGYSYEPAMCRREKAAILSTDSTINEIINLSIQLPMSLNTIEYPPYLSINLNKLIFSFDPILLKFFDYESKANVRHDTVDTQAQPVRSPKKSMNLSERMSYSKKSIAPAESIHSSSDPTIQFVPITKPKQATKNENNFLSELSYWQSISRSLIVLINIKQIQIYCPNKCFEVQTRNIRISLDENKNINYVLYCFPKMIISSSHIRNNMLEFDSDFPVEFSNAIWTKDKDSFPWNVSLIDLNCCTRQDNKILDIVSPMTTNITLAVTAKRKLSDGDKNINNKNAHSLVIHIDTPPVVVNFQQHQILFLHESIMSIISLFSLNSSPQCTEHVEIWERSSSPNFSTELKEFFGTINTISEKSSDDVASSTDLKSSRSIWTQWTFAKLRVNFFGPIEGEERKFTIELEDIITSIGKQDVYLKITSKINSMSGVLKTRPNNEAEWTQNNFLGLTVYSETLSDKLQDKFFDLTITKAITKNVHKKWGESKKKEQNVNETITEIIVNLQPIDIKMNFKYLESFLSIFGKNHGSHLCNEQTPSTPSLSVISVADLPLVHFKSNGLRVFVPTTSNIKKCNVLIFKVDSIIIKPSVDNPLNRIPIRSDIYTKAAQLRMLHTVGSKIEDRQYELLLKQISLGSGKWEEIQNYLDPYSKEDAYNENPAFNWNNDKKKPSVEINTIFKDFNLSVVYAPYIVFRNVLVCGQAIEMNCLTDLICQMTTMELKLIDQVFDEYSQASDIFMCHFSSNYSFQSCTSCKLHHSNSKKLIKIKSGFSFNTILAINEYNRKQKMIELDNKQKKGSENQWTDSGFESQSQTLFRNSKSKFDDKYNTKYPYDVSFVGGIFNIKLYHIPGPTNDVTMPLRLPLLETTLFQPNMFISQGINDRTNKFSLFNLNVKFGGILGAQNEFADVVLDTRQGDLDMFGIPPPFLAFKETITQISGKSLDFHIKRPMIIRFSHKTLEKMLSIYTIFLEFVSLNRPIIKTEMPIDESTKIGIIQNKLFRANHIEFSIDRTDIDFSKSNEYNLKLSFSKIDSKITILEHPQKLSMNFFMKNLMASTDPLIVLSPMSLNINGNLTQENWKKNPLICLSLQSNCVDMNLSPENILNVVKAKTAFMACIEQYNHRQQDVEDVISDSSSFEEVETCTLSKNDSVQEILLPKVQRVESHIIEEYYQDDLRAGAFQFIESKDEDILPLPYQIQIITKNGGIISWRYPQPRTIIYVQIFPVPFHTSITDKMKCELEYYSEPHGHFVNYCNFYLSEKEITELSLPKRKVTAEIWRIRIVQPFVEIGSKIFQEDSSSDEENVGAHLKKSLKTIGIKINTPNLTEYLNQTKTHMPNIHPRALVGCMRIDSSFCPKIIPNIQAVVDISHLSLSLKNNYISSNRKMPDALKQYTLIDDLNNIQTFLKFTMNNIKFHSSFSQMKNVAFDLDLQFSSSILDYSYLTLQPLIEEFSLKAYVDLADMYKINLKTDDIRIRYGPIVGHTLAVSEQIWQQVLTDEPSYLIIVSRYVVCNATNCIIQFGQFHAGEHIYLKPKECCFYAFRTDKLEQKLTFSDDKGKWNPVSSVYVFRDGIQYVKTDTGNILIIQTEKLSGIQKKITIRGQVEIISMTNLPLRGQYKSFNTQETVITTDFNLESMESKSLLLNLDNTTVASLRLQFDDSEYKKGWTGEVPLILSSKNKPWLVKIPTLLPQEFISFWVRIYRENVDLGIAVDEETKYISQRLLIIIWPMFVVRSMLPMESAMYEGTTRRVYELPGRCNTIELEIPATHETSHSLEFHIIDSEIEENNKKSISFRMIDRNTFFAIPNKYEKIESTLAELEKPLPTFWPSSKDEELRLSRPYIYGKFMLPNFTIKNSRELSCSLMLDMSPQSLFFNSTNCIIKLIGTTDSFTIPSNHIGITFTIQEYIIIAIIFHEKWIFSYPIYVTDSSQKTFPSLFLPDEGSTIIKLRSENGISKFILRSNWENDIRMLTMIPFYVVCNFTKYVLNIWAFCVARFDKDQQNQMPSSLDQEGVYSVKNILKKEYNPKGFGITTFFNLSHRYKISPNEMLFNYFLSIQVGWCGDFSTPVLLNRPYNRISFSITSSEGESIPLALSMIENEGQQFICLYDDNCPLIEIENKTDLSLFITEAESVDINRPVFVDSSNDIDHFEWVRYVKPKTSLHYTPPSINENFPDRVEREIAILISHDMNKNWNDPEIEWSRPVKVFEPAELFLNLPIYGDVKVVVTVNDTIVNISISHIDYKMEFNVKDIRTKLLNPVSSLGAPLSLNDSIYYSVDNICTKRNEINDLECLVAESFSKPIHINVFISGLNVVLYNDDEQWNCLKTELISLYVDDILIMFNRQARILELHFANFQIDNQLFSSGDFDFPVLLCSNKVKNYTLEMPSIYDLEDLKIQLQQQFAGSLFLNFYESNYSVKNVFCDIKPIAAYIEDKYINLLLDFMVENVPHNLMYKQDQLPESVVCTDDEILIPRIILMKSQNLSEPFKMEMVRIEPLSVLLSVHTCMRMYIALDHSPLNFSAFEMRDIYSLPMRFGYNIGMHYVSGALFGAGWVVGSLEILGSPSGLARSFSTGLKDFLSMPVQGLLRGPWGFIVGVTQGSASLLRNITAGTVNSVTKLAASVARNLDRLSLDEEHLQRTEALRRLRPQGITDGLAQGLTGLGISLLGAVGGLARHTLEANTAADVFTGIGRGIVGAVTKPISGAAELVALTGQGVLHTVGFNIMPSSRYTIGPTNTSLGPSAAKIIWKYLSLPRTDASDQILFQSLATLETRHGYSNIVVALTMNYIVLISIDRDELIELIELQLAYPDIDKDDDTLVTLNISKNIENDVREAEVFQYNRVLQYIRDASNKLITTNESRNSQLSPELPIQYTPTADHKISFFMNKNLAKHFLLYINVLKKNAIK